MVLSAGIVSSGYRSGVFDPPSAFVLPRLWFDGADGATIENASGATLGNASDGTSLLNGKWRNKGSNGNSSYLQFTAGTVTLKQSIGRSCMSAHGFENSGCVCVCALYMIDQGDLCGGRSGVSAATWVDGTYTIAGT